MNNTLFPQVFHRRNGWYVLHRPCTSCVSSSPANVHSTSLLSSMNPTFQYLKHERKHSHATQLFSSRLSRWRQENVYVFRWWRYLHGRISRNYRKNQRWVYCSWEQLCPLVTFNYQGLGVFVSAALQGTLAINTGAPRRYPAVMLLPTVLSPRLPGCSLQGHGRTGALVFCGEIQHHNK